MSWLEDIGQYLDDNNIGTLETDIFYRGFDEDEPNCIALYDQAGQPATLTNNKSVKLEKPELGIRVRNESGDVSSDKADEIYNLLNLTFNKTIGTTRFKSIKAIAPPFYVSTTTPNNLVIYSINFEIRIG